jgi:hypothetical protein
MTTANNNFIVVEDRTGDYWEGSLVDAARANQLAARGVALLPVIPDLFRLSGVGGYHRRAWGAGWSLDRNVPRIAAPLTMFCAQEYERIHWCARLIPDPAFLERLEQEEPSLLNGFLHIAADPGQVNPHKITLTSPGSINIRSLDKSKLVDGGFNVGGTARIRAPADAHYGFGLFGAAPGLRVAWSAISQAKE